MIARRIGIFGKQYFAETFAGDEFIGSMRSAYSERSDEARTTVIRAGNAIKSSSQEEIEKLSKDEYFLVRWATALNPNTSDEMLKHMLNDPSPDVEGAVRKRLKGGK